MIKPNNLHKRRSRSGRTALVIILMITVAVWSRGEGEKEKNIGKEEILPTEDGNQKEAPQQSKRGAPLIQIKADKGSWGLNPKSPLPLIAPTTHPLRAATLRSSRFKNTRPPVRTRTLNVTYSVLLGCSIPVLVSCLEIVGSSPGVSHAQPMS